MPQVGCDICMGGSFLGPLICPQAAQPCRMHQVGYDICMGGSFLGPPDMSSLLWPRSRAECHGLVVIFAWEVVFRAPDVFSGSAAGQNATG
jgi:hypothetical protein